MTLKEKNMKAFLALQRIKSTANTINSECSEYSSTASIYAKQIIDICNETLNII